MSPSKETIKAMYGFYSKCKLAVDSDGKIYRTDIPRVKPPWLSK